MKSTELRIGNYVFQDDEFIAGITSNSIHKFDICHIKLRPVPLTIKWLTKFGFVEVPHREGCIGAYKLNGIRINLSNSCNYYHGMRIVPFVHTLQNLYFALTGQELTLKSDI